MDKHTEAIVRTTMYLKIVDSEHGCVPEYHLNAVSERLGLSIEECRQIRDTIQMDRLNTQPRPKSDIQEVLYALGGIHSDEHARLFDA